MRRLQDRFRASPLTVQRALHLLAREGLIVTRPGDGSFVAAPSKPISSDYSWQSSVLGRAPFIPDALEHLRASDRPGVLALDGGFPDASLQAHALLGRAATRAARRPDSWERCLPAGTALLRSLFAAELGADFAASDVVITPGIQSAIDSICRSFARPGDSIIIEEPSYPGAIAAATFAGLNIVPIPTDRDGMRTDLLEAASERTGARLVFTQPRYANPTGAMLSLPRRAELLDVAGRVGMFVIEDDWVRDLDLDGPSPAPLVQQDQHGHVLYLRSLSKTTAPGVRIGAVIARGPAAARLTALRVITDFFAAPLLQAVVVELFNDRGWPRHLHGMRAELRLRRNAFATELARSAPGLSFVTPPGGVVLWAKLADSVDEAALVEECRARGVVVGAGRAYWSSEPPGGHLRLSFAATNAEGLQEAAQRIGAAVAATS